MPTARAGSGFSRPVPRGILADECWKLDRSQQHSSSGAAARAFSEARGYTQPNNVTYPYGIQLKGGPSQTK